MTQRQAGVGAKPLTHTTALFHYTNIILMVTILVYPIPIYRFGNGGPGEGSLKQARVRRDQPLGASTCADAVPPISSTASGPACSACPITTTSPRGRTSVSPTSRTSTAARGTTTASSQRRGCSRPGPSCMASPSPTRPGPKPPPARLPVRLPVCPSIRTSGRFLANQGLAGVSPSQSAP